MSAEVPIGEATELDSRIGTGFEQDAVATQLQQVYEHILEGKRPEAVGATERLANQLDVEIERPDQSPARRD